MKVKMKFNKLLLLLFAIALSACGGGGGGGDTTAASSGFSQSYSTSAAAGELMTYSINTNALTYSYTITKSSYGCEVANAACHTGSGTLTKNSDGTYSPSESPTSKIYALQNGLLVGSVQMTLNNVTQRVPILGVSNPATTAADLAGTFNYISLQCTGKTYGVYTGCSTFNGTVTVNANSTYTTCTGANISATPHVCTNTTSGTLSSLGGGIWAFQATSPAVGAATNYFLAFQAPNGQKIAIIDFNDATVYGYGHTVASTLVATSTADVVGTYLWTNDYGQSGVVTLNANNTTSTGLTITQNSPWDGIATVSGGGIGNGYGMIAGNGVYVYRNPNVVGKAAYFELGLKIQ
jgi:hypothetical protein